MNSQAPFTFGTSSSSASKMNALFPSNAMYSISQSVGQDIAEYLIREAAKKEREIIRTKALARLKDITDAYTFNSNPKPPGNRHITPWEAHQENPEQERLRRTVFFVSVLLEILLCL